MRRLPMIAPEPSTIVVYRGPSALDGSPIVGVLSGLGRPSKNTKTGEMLQLWILPAELKPHEAQRTGDDASVCGDCPKRPLLVAPGDLPCYVKTFQGPRSVWEATRDQRADLDRATSAVGASDRALRLGAYGDPAALPVSVVAALTEASIAHTGYTHQWRDPRHASLRDYVMASVETADQAHLARQQGWRTFRVIPRTQVWADLAKEEIWCAAVSSGVTCAQCRLCDGTGRAPDRKSIAIIEH